MMKIVGGGDEMMGSNDEKRMTKERMGADEKRMMKERMGADDKMCVVWT